MLSVWTDIDVKNTEKKSGAKEHKRISGWSNAFFKKTNKSEPTRLNYNFMCLFYDLNTGICFWILWKYQELENLPSKIFKIFTVK